MLDVSLFHAVLQRTRQSDEAYWPQHLQDIINSEIYESEVKSHLESMSSHVASMSAEVKAMGFAAEPKQIFDYFATDDQEKLLSNNYFFVNAAITHAFDESLIPSDLLTQLNIDLNHRLQQSKYIQEDLQSYQDKALFTIALGYETGNEVLAKNKRLAIRWAHLALARGNIWAATYIGENCFYNKEFGNSPDINYHSAENITVKHAHVNDVQLKYEAMKYFHLAAYHGNMLASFNLAVIYRKGLLGLAV